MIKISASRFPLVRWVTLNRVCYIMECSDLNRVCYIMECSDINRVCYFMESSDLNRVCYIMECSELNRVCYIMEFSDLNRVCYIMECSVFNRVCYIMKCSDLNFRSCRTWRLWFTKKKTSSTSTQHGVMKLIKLWNKRWPSWKWKTTTYNRCV